MKNDKIKELYEKSQEIISMMNILGIKNYYDYSIQCTILVNFLILNNIPITPFLIDTYVNNDLNKFIPKTNIEILKKFNFDIENNLF